jgi:methionine-S-sulfoxide reductase
MAEEKKAYFAGGCFWCVEEAFEKTTGVIKAISGYTGGHVKNPTYEQVTYKETGHFEAVEVTYDPSKVSYEDLLKIFWRNIDPFDAEGQFCDKGSSYLSAVFYQNDQEKKAFEKSKEELKIDKSKITTVSKPLEIFYNAEDYHQDYYKKNPIRYNLYKTGCGRETKLKKIWE